MLDIIEVKSDKLIWPDTVRNPNSKLFIRTGNDRQSCENRLPSSGYGAAISYCIEDEDGKFWVGHGEYESQVNYCPICGLSASVRK